MRYLIVVPARGGSKGIPKKNIAPLGEKPLLAYTLDLIQTNFNGSTIVESDTVVSTDSEEIADVARCYPCVEVVMRPAEISGDTASTEDALLHALRVMEEKKNKPYDAVVTLQPTSPFRRVETFIDFLKTFEKDIEKYDALLSLHETRTDYWVKKEGNEYGRLNPDAPRRRQDREPMYIENSAYYATTVESLKKAHSVLGTRVNGYVISEREGMDINEPIDLLIAEKRMEEEKE